MTFTIPRSFFPPASPLGRWVRRRSVDARQAESRYFVAAALVLTAVALLSQWVWLLGDGKALSLAAQVGGWTFVLWFAGWGWKPMITLRLSRSALEARRGATTWTMDYEAVERAERISAATYHRHWRRYAAPHVFVNQLPSDLLLLHTNAGPAIFGLAPDTLDQFGTALAERMASSEGLLTRERIASTA